MLMTRGVPGTHDVDLMLNFFKKIKKLKILKDYKCQHSIKRLMTDYPKRIWHKIKKKPDVMYSLKAGV